MGLLYNRLMDEEKTDEEIALSVQKGEKTVFGVLVERYEAKMLRYAKKFLFGYEEAEDIVQEVFIKAYVNIQSFDSHRRFSPWLYRVAHNEFINAIKKKGREPLSFFDPDTLFPHPLSKDRPEQEVNDKELKQMLDRCLNQLDPKYREPLILYFFEDLNYDQISEIMHIPVSTVGVRLKRGKTLLQEIYKKSPHKL